MISIMKETTTVQKAIYRNQLQDGDDCLDYMMKQPNIMPRYGKNFVNPNDLRQYLDLLLISVVFYYRLNDRILKAENAAFVDLTGESYPTLELETFATLNQQMMAGTLAKHLKYLTSNKKDKLHVLTAWTVVDLERPQGRELFRGALTQFKASNQLRIGKREGYGKQGGIFRKMSF